MEPLEKLKYGRSYFEEIQNQEGDKAEAVWRDAESRYQRLAAENAALPEKVKAHTEKMIFPAIAVYQALRAVDPERAMAVMEAAEGRVSKATGASYSRAVGLPFMRRVFLRIFSKGAKNGFSEDSGFVNRPVRDEKREVAFTIEKCPYHDWCVKCGCPELVHIFCDNDINAYGHLPGIAFERHQTLGTGGSCCDFRLYLKK